MLAGIGSMQALVPPQITEMLRGRRDRELVAEARLHAALGRVRAGARVLPPARATPRRRRAADA